MIWLPENSNSNGTSISRFELFADLGLLFRRHKQQDESAAARAQQLAADGAGLPRVRQTSRPRGRWKPCRSRRAWPAMPDAAIRQTPSRSWPLFRIAQLCSTYSCIRVSSAARSSMPADVTRGDVRRRALDAGVKQHQVRIQFRQPRRRERHRLHGEIAVLQKADAVQAAVSRADLVLRADGFLQHLLLEVDALARPVVFFRPRGLAAHGARGAGPP